MKVFVYDEAKCNGCRCCQFACKDEHCDNEWLPYAKKQPMTGQFWNRVDDEILGQGTKLRGDYHLHMCNHCGNPGCVAAAKDGAAYVREDGLVIIDPVKAQGQKAIVDACPYGQVWWNEDLQIPQKCTGCAHLIDEGELPHCVDVCPNGALRFGEFEDFADEIAQAEPAEHGTDPHFFRLNRKKLFAAGEVWDPAIDECIMDAKVVLTDKATGATCELATDRFGDFWFENLEKGLYQVDIAAEGYAPESREFELVECLNLGEFKLVKA